MVAADLEELWRRKKVQLVALVEVSNLTGQLAYAARRRDQVSMEVLLGMRETPLRRICEMEAAINNYVCHLPQADAIRAQELLDGAEAVETQEVPLQEQVSQYRRLLRTVVEQDSEISLGSGGERSFYRMYRGSRSPNGAG